MTQCKRQMCKQMVSTIHTCTGARSRRLCVYCSVLSSPGRHRTSMMHKCNVTLWCSLIPTYLQGSENILHFKWNFSFFTQETFVEYFSCTQPCSSCVESKERNFFLELTPILGQEVNAWNTQPMWNEAGLTVVVYFVTDKKKSYTNPG